MLSDKTVSMSVFFPRLCWFASSFTHFWWMSHVLYVFVLVSFLFVHEVSKCCTHVYVMWCVYQTGLTFSYFKLTLPGVGGWRCRGQTEVICRSDPLSQLWDGTAELTGLRYPRPYLVFGFPPSLFSAHMALYDICPSAFSQINTTRWARNGLGGEDCVHVSFSEVQQFGKMGKLEHESRMAEGI